MQCQPGNTCHAKFLLQKRSTAITVRSLRPGRDVLRRASDSAACVVVGGKWAQLLVAVSKLGGAGRKLNTEAACWE